MMKDILLAISALSAGLAPAAQLITPTGVANSPGGDRLGLGEVKFVVPEPSSVLLSGLAALALLRRRR